MSSVFLFQDYFLIFNPFWIPEELKNKAQEELFDFLPKSVIRTGLDTFSTA